MPVLLLLPFVALPLPACEDPEPPKDPRKEVARLQGEWEMVSCETNGKDEPLDKQPKKFTLTIKGDQWILKLGDGKGPNERADHQFQVDPFKNPKRLDWMKGGKVVMPCIYKLQGDTLTVCRGYVNNVPTRLKEFKTTTVSEQLTVWKRVKK